MNVNSNMTNTFSYGRGMWFTPCTSIQQFCLRFFPEKGFKELLLCYVKNVSLVHKNNSNDRRSRQAQK